MAAHSGVLAWRTPWTEEPGGQQPRESRRVRHAHTQHASTGEVRSNLALLFCGEVK